jgi:hypothetical protein
MVLNLVREFGTRYIIDALFMKFRSYVESAINDGNQIDIANAKFGPKCGSVVQDKVGSGVFLDSKNEEINHILEHNCAIKNTHYEEYEELEITGTSREGLKKLIASLPKGAKLSLPAISYSERAYAFFTLLILQRPDIEWDISICSKNLFDFIRSKWLISGGRRPHKKYIEVIGSALVERSVGIAKRVILDGGKFESETSFVNNHTCLPAEFSSDKLLQISPNGEVTGEFAPVFTRCWDILDIPTIHVPSIEDHLTFRRNN